jgi:Xaa-Pro aminopeptidase
VLIFTPTEIHALSGSKKTDILRQLEGACQEAAGVTLNLHTKPKKESGAEQISELIAVVKRAASDKSDFKVGTLPKVRNGNRCEENVGAGRKCHGVQHLLYLLCCAYDDPSCVFFQEKPVGALADAWKQALSDTGLATADIAPALASVMSAKDEDEVKNVRKAAFLVSSALNNRGVKDIEGEQSFSINLVLLQ